MLINENMYEIKRKILVSLKQSKWNDIKRKNIWPTSKKGTTINYYNGNIYLYGGSIDKYTFSNQLWKYNVNDNIWQKMITYNETPKCSGYKMVLYKNYLILFGGYAMIKNKYIFYDDIFMYNCDNNTWNKFKCNNKPRKRYWHGMCIVNNKLIVYGGLDVKDKHINDMHSINVDDIINDNSPEWIKINDRISPLYGHLMVGNQDKLYCFGGCGQMFGKRLRNNDLLIYDGNDFNAKTSHKMKTIEQRSSHNGCIIHLNGKDYIFIFGGYQGNYSFNDSFLIYIQDSNVDKIYKMKPNMVEQKDADEMETMILKYNNEINKLKKEINLSNETCNDLIELNEQQSSKIATFEGIKNEYEVKIESLSNKINHLVRVNGKEQQITKKYENEINLLKEKNIYLRKMNEEQLTKITILEGIQNENENKIQSLSNDLERLTNETKDQIKLLKQNNDDLTKMNQQQSIKITKLEAIKTKYESKINNEQKLDQKLDNGLTKKQQSFKEYFFSTFDNMKSNKIYYHNLIENDINDFDFFIVIENMDDINEYIKPKNKLHASVILKKIKQIKIDRDNFETKLRTLNMYHYLNLFDSNGIYTLNEYNIKIKSINDIKKIINDNNQSCSLIFNTFKNNYGISDGPQQTKRF